MQAHGIMFHGFHDDRHIRTQGSISAEQLAAIIGFLGRDRIVPAQEWLRRAELGTLGDRDLCLTFDDGLLSQFDVAGPILADLKLTALWFICTSPIDGVPVREEIYRRFRHTQFDSIDDFYREFFRALNSSDFGAEAADALAAFDPREYLQEFRFYSAEDRRFRFVRDRVLGRAGYDRLMTALITGKGVAAEALEKDAWMDAGCLRRLHAAGHVIGLHSHTHPTCLGELPAAEQAREYRINRDRLAQITGEQPTAMAHPCNSYNVDTIGVLRELGVRVGFRANLAHSRPSLLELPRRDHVDVLGEMQRCG